MYLDQLFLGLRGVLRSMREVTLEINTYISI